MRIEWECNQVYDDGSQGGSSYYIVYDSNGNRLGHGHLENYTFVSDRANEPEYDKRNQFRRSHCYNVTDDFGWWNHGIDENTEYRTNDREKYFGVWCKPEHTQEEVKRLIEQHIVEYFEFDEEAERKDFEKRMARRRCLMDEASHLESVEVDELYYYAQ